MHYVNLLLISIPLCSPLQTYSQQRTYLGDAIFQYDSRKDSLDINAFYTQVEVGHLFNKSKKHGLIFQQIDSVEYINELKLITFNQEKTKEKLIDTFEIGHFHEFKRVDMNHDGHLDLIITQGSNYAWSRLYIFDPMADNLIVIPAFKAHRAVERLGDTDYFYSYGSLGCADSEWKSKLFQVEGTEIIDYGVIHGKGCSQEVANRIIEIEFGGTKKTLPFNETLPYHGDKLPFIKHYWEELILNN